MTQRTSTESILTEEEVAELLKVRRSMVRDLARRGALPAIWLGRHRRFVEAEVLAAARQLRKEAAPRA
jgi:excisionase family DNA binding protein